MSKHTIRLELTDETMRQLSGVAQLTGWSPEEVCQHLLTVLLEKLSRDILRADVLDRDRGEIH